MRNIGFQSWLTLQGTSTTTSITQTASEWLDLAAYEDFVAWVEVESLVAGGATSPTLFLESAPLKEDVLFSPTGGSHPSVALAVGVTTAKNILNGSAPNQIPVARWLRWRVAMTGASSNWSLTFQIHLAAHSMCLPSLF